MSKSRLVEGDARVADAHIAILVTRWNSFITDSLLQSAQGALQRNGVADENVTLVRVPGAFELPLAAKSVAAQGGLDAIVALGCVIRGDTPHFEYVCHGCMEGLMQVQLESGVPITFGVLTVDHADQAVARASDDANNKGEEAALTALEMINVLRELRR